MARTRTTNPIADDSKYKKGEVVLVKVVDQDGSDIYYFAEVFLT